MSEFWGDAAGQIQPELGSGERLLWSGSPPSGVVLRASDIFLIPFSLMWGGFAIVWEAGVIIAGAPWFFMIWGIPFVLIGLYMIAGRFWVDARQRANTYYGVTNERVIIVSGLFRRSIKSLNIDTLTDVSLTEKGNGAGTIALGPTHPFAGWYGNASWPGMPGAASVLDLPESAKEVYEIIRGAQREARRVC